MISPGPGLILFMYIDKNKPTKKHSLGRSERVKSRKLTGMLFDTGLHFSVFPFRVHYLAIPGKATLQAGFTAGTRYFKKATHRNRVKRLMRETYRLQKESLQQKVFDRSINLAVFFVYTGKDLPEPEELGTKMLAVLQKLERLVYEIPAAHS